MSAPTSEETASQSIGSTFLTTTEMTAITHLAMDETLPVRLNLAMSDQEGIPIPLILVTFTAEME